MRTNYMLLLLTLGRLFTLKSLRHGAYMIFLWINPLNVNDDTTIHITTTQTDNICGEAPLD